MPVIEYIISVEVDDSDIIAAVDFIATLEDMVNQQSFCMGIDDASSYRTE